MRLLRNREPLQEVYELKTSAENYSLRYTSWCANYDCDALWMQNFQDGGYSSVLRVVLRSFCSVSKDNICLYFFCEEKQIKTCVFLAPIRSQNGGDRLELVW